MNKNTFFGATLLLALIIYIIINTFADSLSLDLATAGNVLAKIVLLAIILLILQLSHFLTLSENIHVIIAVLFLCFWNALTYWASPFKNTEMMSIPGIQEQMAWYGLWYWKVAIAASILCVGEYIKRAFE